MMVTVLWWTIRVSITMDTKRAPVRHLIILVSILSVVIVAYVLVSSTSTPTAILPKTTVRVHKSYENLEKVSNNAIDETEGGHHKSTQAQQIISPLYDKVSTNSRKERCLKCFQPRIVPIIPAKYLCRPTEIAGTVDIVTLIFSHVSHYQRRETIRQTWASPTKQNTAILRHIFVLGLSNDPEENRNVQFENKENLDIVQFDFLDTYGNLTLKTIGAFKWVLQRCAHAKHTVKTDDDMWMNLQRLLWVLPRYDLYKSIGGFCLKDTEPIRDVNSKWYVSYDAYKNSKYPPFCSGTGYVLQTETVKDIIKISPDIPYYHLEDVYIGLCFEQLGYKTQSLPGFHNTFVHFDPCTYRKTIVTSHEVNDELLHLAWSSDCTVHPYLDEST